MYRLAGIHNRHARSIENSDKNQILNRYEYLYEQFNWLKEYLPENKLDQILQLMAYSRTQRKISKELAGLNLQDLALILAFWELDVYPLGNYIVEEVLQDINDYLRTYSNNFKIRGVVSIKDIQMAQELILSDLYALEFNQKTRCFRIIPDEALQFYRNFLYSFEEAIPIGFAQKIKKARTKRPDLVIPSSVYIWVVRKKLLQAMLPFLTVKIGLKQISLKDLKHFAEQFWNSVFHQKAIGDLPTIGFLLIETWQEAHNQQLPIRLTSLHKVEKFKTRIKAYRRRFRELMIKSLPEDLQNRKNEKEEQNKKNQIKLLCKQIERIEKWLNQFNSPASQKLLQRSPILKNTYDENRKVITTLQQELQKLKVSGSKFSPKSDHLKDYKLLQNQILENLVEILDTYQILIVSSPEKSIKTKRILRIEETILPSLQIQIQACKDRLTFLATSEKNQKKEVDKCNNLILQVDQHFDALSQALKQKIEEQINFHLINDPLQSFTESFNL
jgi:hypothetical protein